MTTTPDAVPLTHVPRPVVRVNGSEWGAALDASLAAVRVRQQVSAPAACELECDLLADVPGPRPGDQVSVAFGPDPTPVFTGEVVALEHVLPPDRHPRLRVRCLDAAHRLRDARVVAAHHDVTVADITRTLAGAAGLGVEAEADGPRWSHVVQAAESGLAFLDRLVERAALWWQVDQKALHLRPRTPLEERTARWGADLVEAVVTTDAAPAYGVRTRGWDPAEPAAVLGEWTPPDADADARTLPAGVLPGGEHAESAARAAGQRAEAGRRRVRAVLRGDPVWRPGVALRLEGVPGVPTGPFWLTSVEHVLDAASGYLCLADSTPPPPPPATPVAAGPPAGVTEPAADTLAGPDAAGFTLAVVVDVTDPAGLGRVRCRVPAWDDVDTAWLPVVSAGAGLDKGLLAQPDVDDTVVVLHPLADPLRGVVLGGLYRTDAPPAGAAGVRDGGVRDVGWATPDGQTLRLERDADAATVANAAGSTLRLAAEGVQLHAEADLVIEAPGRRIVLRADAIDFERG